MRFFNVKHSLTVGTFAAIGASACCVVPLVLVMLGIGGAWVNNLVELAPYQPVFIGLTLIFFGIAFGQLYLVRPVCASAPCTVENTLRRQRVIFWIATVSMLALLVAPMLAFLFI